MCLYNVDVYVCVSVEEEVFFITDYIFRPTIEGSVSEVEIISQQVEEETKSIAPVQLVNFAYRDLPLAALDLSVAGSQLLSNLDEEYQREG